MYDYLHITTPPFGSDGSGLQKSHPHLARGNERLLSARAASGCASLPPKRRKAPVGAPRRAIAAGSSPLAPRARARRSVKATRVNKEGHSRRPSRSPPGRKANETVRPAGPLTHRARAPIVSAVYRPSGRAIEIWRAPRSRRAIASHRRSRRRPSRAFPGPRPARSRPSPTATDRPRRARSAPFQTRAALGAEPAHIRARLFPHRAPAAFFFLDRDRSPPALLPPLNPNPSNSSSR